jgi:DNA-binding NarL/FixJ family response regulator
MPINVAILENDRQTLNGLSRLIDSTEGLCCSGRYSCLVSALNEFFDSLPDVLLMDINLPGLDEVDSVRRIKADYPDLLVLVLTSLEGINAVFSAISGGAVGYLLKHSSPDQIISAIRDVYQGGSPITGSIARQILGLFQQTAVTGHPHQKLSLREQEVLDHLAWGHSYQKIANELEISYTTVHTHIRHIYKKLRVNCRTDAVTYYLRPHPRWLVPAQGRQARMAALFNGADSPGDFATAGAI